HPTRRASPEAAARHPRWAAGGPHTRPSPLARSTRGRRDSGGGDGQRHASGPGPDARRVRDRGRAGQRHRTFRGPAMLLRIVRRYLRPYLGSVVLLLMLQVAATVGAHYLPALNATNVNDGATQDDHGQAHQL